MKSILNPIEDLKLQRLEKTIEAGRKTFVDVAKALSEIRDGRLYRSQYVTFEEYCRERWNFTRQYVNQLIAGADALKSLPPNLETIVSKPGQARELAKVPEEKRVEVVKEAAANGHVTAKSIQSAAKKYLPPPPIVNPKKLPVPDRKAAPAVVDKTGYPVPAALIPLWERGYEALTDLNQLSHLKAKYERLQTEKDPLYVEVNKQRVFAQLSQVWTDIKTAVPFAVCTACQGKTPDACTLCKGRGLISEFVWKHSVPEEVKAMRKKLTK